MWNAAITVLRPAPGACSSTQSSVGMNITADVTSQIGIRTHIVDTGATPTRQTVKP